MDKSNKTYCELVREFTIKHAGSVPDKPRMLSSESVSFIREMVQDEMDELKLATGLDDQADALVDAIYYICDTAVRNGIDLDPLFSIVHTANLRKLRNKMIKSENGKVEKPDDWKGPDDEFHNELLRQQQYGSF